MTMFKIMLLGKAGYSDIYRGSERRRFGDKSTIDQILILNYFLKKNKFYQDLIKWKFGILTKLILGFNSIKSKGLSVLLYFLKNRILKLIKRFV